LPYSYGYEAANPEKTVLAEAEFGYAALRERFDAGSPTGVRRESVSPKHLQEAMLRAQLATLAGVKVYAATKAMWDTPAFLTRRIKPCGEFSNW